jgi:hypothetical protein
MRIRDGTKSSLAALVELRLGKKCRHFAQDLIDLAQLPILALEHSPKRPCVSARTVFSLLPADGPARWA